MSSNFHPTLYLGPGGDWISLDYQVHLLLHYVEVALAEREVFDVFEELTVLYDFPSLEYVSISEQAYRGRLSELLIRQGEQYMRDFSWVPNDLIDDYMGAYHLLDIIHLALISRWKTESKRVGTPLEFLLAFLSPESRLAWKKVREELFTSVKQLPRKKN